MYPNLFMMNLKEYLKLYIKKYRYQINTILFVSILLMAGIKFCYHLEDIVDIGLADESLYLYKGASMARLGINREEWVNYYAPSYSIWYYLLSHFTTNNITLYYLNFRLMTILPPILFFLFLRSNKAPILMSLLLSWFLILSQSNVYVWPKISHFALILLLVSMIVIQKIKYLHMKVIFVVLTTLLVSFARPEYFIIFILSVLFLIYLVIKRRKDFQRAEFIKIFGAVLIAFLLIKLLGMPISISRFILAFGQHFSMNFVSWTNSSLKPLYEWNTILLRNFGSHDTMSKTITAGSLLFFRHIKMNLFTVIKVITTLTYPAFFPQDQLSMKLGLIFFVFFCGVNAKTICKNVIENFTNLCIIILYSLPGIASSLIIYPREHYLVIPLTLNLMFIFFLATKDKIDYKHTRFSQIILIGILLIWITPGLSLDHRGNQPTLGTINYVKSLNLDQNIKMLENDGGYCYYINETCEATMGFSKTQNFIEFLKTENINLVVVTNSLLEESKLVNDPEWQDFLINFSQYGFEKLDIPEINNYLIISSNLLNNNVEP